MTIYHEGPPGVHVFTFPDQQSRDEFVQRLFSKGMVMMPNGSRHFEDYQKEHMSPSVVPSPTPQTTKSRLSELKANGEESEVGRQNIPIPRPGK